MAEKLIQQLEDSISAKRSLLSQTKIISQAKKKIFSSILKKIRFFFVEMVGQHQMLNI